jgi:hypothetical protein
MKIFIKIKSPSAKAKGLEIVWLPYRFLIGTKLVDIST